MPLGFEEIIIGKFYRVISDIYSTEGLLNGAVVRALEKEEGYVHCEQVLSGYLKPAAWIPVSDLDNIK